MSELGQRLKQSREEKKISLEELQKITKIQKRYLLAIEEGQFEALPGKFYARAFVKSYAEAVGLHPDALFEEFAHELPNPKKEVTDLPSRSERVNAKVEPSRSKWMSFLPAVVAATLIIVVIVGIWIFMQESNEQAEGVIRGDQNETFEGELNEELPVAEEDVNDADQQSEEGEPGETVEGTPEIEEPEAVQQLTLLNTEGNHSFYELSGTDQFEVELRFAGTSYVQIQNGKGNTFFESPPNAVEGDTMTYDFSGEEEIYFNLGASTFVEMLVNGEVFEFPLDSPHQKVTITMLPRATNTNR